MATITSVVSTVNNVPKNCCIETGMSSSMVYISCREIGLSLACQTHPSVGD